MDSRFLPSVFAEFAEAGPPDSRKVYCSLGGFEQALSQARPERPLVIILDQFEELLRSVRTDNRDLQGRSSMSWRTGQPEGLGRQNNPGDPRGFSGKLRVISKEYPQVFDRRVQLDLLGPDAAKRRSSVVRAAGRVRGGISAVTADAVIGEFGKGRSMQVSIRRSCRSSAAARNEYSEQSLITRDHFLAMKSEGHPRRVPRSTVSALSPAQRLPPEYWAN
jgi:hypothetical protein